MVHWYCENRGNLINQIFPNTPENDTYKVDNKMGYINNTPEQKKAAKDIENSIVDAVIRGRANVKDV